MDENKEKNEGAENTAPVNEEAAKTADEAENQQIKADVEKKIKKQMEKHQEKYETKSRILEYLATEHKWENYLFIAVSAITLILGCLILTDVLVVKDDIPVIGDYPDVFAWVLVGIAALGLIYALWPIYKPAIPEFKKITWLSGKDFLGNTIRTFLFILIFAGLFVLYDYFITEILQRIISTF